MRDINRKRENKQICKIIIVLSFLTLTVNPQSVTTLTRPSCHVNVCSTTTMSYVLMNNSSSSYTRKLKPTSWDAGFCESSVDSAGRCHSITSIDRLPIAGRVPNTSDDQCQLDAATGWVGIVRKLAGVSTHGH